MKLAKQRKIKFETCWVEGPHRVRAGTVLTYRQRTLYQDEASNYFTGCAKCREANDAYWDAMWNEYYSGCL